jgi:hypothetical protein
MILPLKYSEAPGTDAILDAKAPLVNDSAVEIVDFFFN